MIIIIACNHLAEVNKGLFLIISQLHGFHTSGVFNLWAVFPDSVSFWRGQLRTITSTFKKFGSELLLEVTKLLNTAAEYIQLVGFMRRRHFFTADLCVRVFLPYVTMGEGEGAAAVPLRHVAPVLRARPPPRNQWTGGATPSRLGRPSALQPSLHSSGVTWEVVVMWLLTGQPTLRKMGPFSDFCDFSAQVQNTLNNTRFDINLHEEFLLFYFLTTSGSIYLLYLFLILLSNM